MLIDNIYDYASGFTVICFLVVAHSLSTTLLFFHLCGGAYGNKILLFVLTCELPCAAAGLQVLQLKHLIHRDLKPQVLCLFLKV